MFKIKNITTSSRKFRIHKLATSYFIRPGEELIVSHRPIISNPNIFKVTNLEDIKIEEKRNVEKKITKLEDKK